MCKIGNISYSIGVRPSTRPHRTGSVDLYEQINEKHFQQRTGDELCVFSVGSAVGRLLF
jgi:hypothetical protein